MGQMEPMEQTNHPDETVSHKRNSFYQKPLFLFLCIFLLLGSTSKSTSDQTEPLNSIFDYPRTPKTILDTSVVTRTRCEEIINFYGIDINIRSTSGWKRVVKYKNTSLYINRNNYQKYYIPYLEQCLLNSNKLILDRDRGDQQ